MKKSCFVIRVFSRRSSAVERSTRFCRVSVHTDAVYRVCLMSTDRNHIVHSHGEHVQKLDNTMYLVTWQLMITSLCLLSASATAE